MHPIHKTYPAWLSLDAEAGGRLEIRAHEIRRDHPSLTRMEAIMKVMAEQRYDCMETAILFGIDERTVHNHHTNIRRKAEAPRSVPFRDIFCPDIFQNWLFLYPIKELIASLDDLLSFLFRRLCLL